MAFLCACCTSAEVQPVVILSPADGYTVVGGESVTFAASTAGMEGTVSRAVWHFGDGATAKGITATYAYPLQGTYTARIEITNEYAVSFSDRVTVSVAPSRFIKLADGGLGLPDNATSWSMVCDRTTGLVWEVKQESDANPNYENPRDADNTYTWYDPVPETNGGDPGTPGDGSDTADFIATLNSEQFGDYDQWRLPTREELVGILDLHRFNPAICTEFFPNTRSWFYWTSTTYEEEAFNYAAYHIDFLGNPTYRARRTTFGTSNHYGMKDLAYHARAVTDSPPVSFWSGDEVVTVTFLDDSTPVSLDGLPITVYQSKDMVLLSTVVEAAHVVDDPENYFYVFHASDGFSFENALLNEDFGTGFPPWQDMRKGYLFQTFTDHYGLKLVWEYDTIGGAIGHCYNVRLMDGGTIELKTDDAVYPE